MDLKTHYDVVVIGGGHNGLVAAAYLAGAGQSVLLIERNPVLGGATVSQRIFDGMDARLSRYSYLVSLLPAEIVRDLDLCFTARSRSMAACSPFQRNGRHGALLLSNSNPSRSRASLRSLIGEDGLPGYEQFRELERVFAQLVWPGYLQPLRTRREWEASLQGREQRAAWSAFVDRPLGETLEKYVKDDVLRGLIFTDAKIGVLTHPHDQSLLQNRCFVLHIVGQGTGEWRVPVGGMSELVTQLIRAATRSGASLLAGSAVQAIHPGTSRHAVAFLHEGRETQVEASRVLVNAGPQVLARLTGTRYGPAPEDEGSVCKVNVLLSRLPRLRAENVSPEEAFTGTFHLDQGYAQMQASYQQAERGQTPDPAPAELYCHSLTDASILGPALRQAGYQTLTLFGVDAPYRLFTEDNARARDEFLRRYLAGLNRVLAEPIEDCIARDASGNPCIEIKSPRDLEEELALYQGNIFHSAPTWFFAEDEKQAGTWGVRTAFERIYLCGSSAPRGGGVSGIPGYAAARQVLEELRITPHSAVGSAG